MTKDSERLIELGRTQERVASRAIIEFEKQSVIRNIGVWLSKQKDFDRYITVQDIDDSVPPSVDY